MASHSKGDAGDARKTSGKTTKMSLSDCKCPICMYIMIEPVTMPCRHELCMDCFKHNVQETSLTCPMCRMRIATWSRKAARNNKLINQVRWKEIQEAFPQRVKNRLEGREDDDEEEEEEHVPCQHLSKPGEIRQEYEAELKKLVAEQEARRLREEEESKQLIKQMQEEEVRRRYQEQQLQLTDEALARELEEAFTKETVSTPDINAFLGTRTDSRNKKVTLLDKYLERGKKPTASRDDKYPYFSISPSDKDSTPKAETISLDNIPRVPTRGSSVSYVYVGSRESSRMGDFVGEIGEDITLEDAELGDKDKTILYTYEPATQSEIDDKIMTPSVVKLRSGSRQSSKSSTNTDKLLDEMGRESRQDGRPESATSQDSITQELLHFKPIHVCPKTPPRRMPSGQLMEPKLVRSTPVNLSRPGTMSPQTCLSPQVPGGSPIIKRRLQELAAERQTNVWKNSKSTATEMKRTAIMQEHSYSTPTHVSGRLTLQQLCSSPRASAATTATLTDPTKRKLPFTQDKLEKISELPVMPQLPEDFEAEPIPHMSTALFPLESNLDDDPEDDHIFPEAFSKLAKPPLPKLSSPPVKQSASWHMPPGGRQTNDAPAKSASSPGIDRFFNPQDKAAVSASGNNDKFPVGKVYMMKLNNSKNNQVMAKNSKKTEKESKSSIKNWLTSPSTKKETTQENFVLNTDTFMGFSEPFVLTTLLTPCKLAERKEQVSKQEYVEETPLMVQNLRQGKPPVSSTTPTKVKLKFDADDLRRTEQSEVNGQKNIEEASEIVGETSSGRNTLETMCDKVKGFFSMDAKTDNDQNEGHCKKQPKSSETLQRVENKQSKPQQLYEMGEYFSEEIDSGTRTEMEGKEDQEEERRREEVISEDEDVKSEKEITFKKKDKTSTCRREEVISEDEDVESEKEITFKKKSKTSSIRREDMSEAEDVESEKEITFKKKGKASTCQTKLNDNKGETTTKREQRTGMTIKQFLNCEKTERNVSHVDSSVSSGLTCEAISKELPGVKTNKKQVQKTLKCDSVTEKGKQTIAGEIVDEIITQTLNPNSQSNYEIPNKSKRRAKIETVRNLVDSPMKKVTDADATPVKKNKMKSSRNSDSSWTKRSNSEAKSPAKQRKQKLSQKKQQDNGQSIASEEENEVCTPAKKRRGRKLQVNHGVIQDRNTSSEADIEGKVSSSTPRKADKIKTGQVQKDSFDQTRSPVKKVRRRRIISSETSENDSPRKRGKNTSQTESINSVASSLHKVHREGVQTGSDTSKEAGSPAKKYRRRRLKSEQETASDIDSPIKKCRRGIIQTESSTPVKKSRRRKVESEDDGDTGSPVKRVLRGQVPSEVAAHRSQSPGKITETNTLPNELVTSQENNILVQSEVEEKEPVEQESDFQNFSPETKFLEIRPRRPIRSDLRLHTETLKTLQSDEKVTKDINIGTENDTQPTVKSRRGRKYRADLGSDSELAGKKYIKIQNKTSKKSFGDATEMSDGKVQGEMEKSKLSVRNKTKRKKDDGDKNEKDIVEEEVNNNFLEPEKESKKRNRSVEDKENDLDSDVFDSPSKKTRVKKDIKEEKNEVKVTPQKKGQRNNKHLEYTLRSGGKKVKVVRRGQPRNTKVSLFSSSEIDEEENEDVFVKEDLKVKGSQQKKCLLMQKISPLKKAVGKGKGAKGGKKGKNSNSGQMRLEDFCARMANKRSASVSTKKSTSLSTMGDSGDEADLMGQDDFAPDDPRKERKDFSSQAEFQTYNEEQDRLLALQLQSDFDLELKYNLNTIRTKGSQDEYSLRRKSSNYKPYLDEAMPGPSRSRSKRSKNT